MFRPRMAGAFALGIMTGIAAVSLAVGASAQNAPKMWDGVIIPTSGCVDFDDTWRASYRPKIKGADPRSSIVVWSQQNTVRLEKETNGQFHGAGQFSSVGLQDFDNGRFEFDNAQFNFTQTPNPVTANTKFIEITGTIMGPGGIGPGLLCATEIRAVFSARNAPVLD